MQIYGAHAIQKKPEEDEHDKHTAGQKVAAGEADGHLRALQVLRETRKLANQSALPPEVYNKADTICSHKKKTTMNHLALSHPGHPDFSVFSKFLVTRDTFPGSPECFLNEVLLYSEEIRKTRRSSRRTLIRYNIPV